MRRKVWIIGSVATAIVLVLLLLVRLRYGGGAAFPDPELPPPVLASSANADPLETVAELPYPPGNITLSSDGRIFVTLHPEGAPPFNVGELRNGELAPYPAAAFQPGGEAPLRFQSVLSLRVDAVRDWLWTLDYADHGTGQPRLLAFDLKDDSLVHRYDFPADVLGFGSHANDFQISPDGRWIYITDASIVGRSSALVVYDVQTERAWRLLEEHESVQPGGYVSVVQGRAMQLLGGLVTVDPGADGIALTRDGRWLYFASISGLHLYRIETKHLHDPLVTDEELASYIEQFARKTVTDGMIADASGNIYLTDFPNDAIRFFTPGGELRTLVVDERLRWPDGFSIGPDGMLYVTCSALHQVIGKSAEFRDSKAPFQVYRVRLPD